MRTTTAAALRRGIALLSTDRPAALDAIERCFSGGDVPRGLDGPLRGRLVATTVGHRLDGAFERLAHWWMPWHGKAFSASSGDGRNLFSGAVGPIARLTMPTYRDLRALPDGGCSAFRFLTSIGPSALVAGTDVLRIDYRGVPENPRWPVRRVLDELVQVDDGLFLGQALLEWRGGLRRAAWFSLER